MSEPNTSTLYKTYARKETHPARIGAIARLYGLAAADASRCRVLEFACGDGSNIISMAVQYPDSSFVGVDSNEALIARGRVIVEALGLKNITLDCVDLAYYHPEVSSYDYVLCHGLYSWVSSDLQRVILERGVTALAAQGVFYVSYNTLPGWRQRGVIRDILQVGASVHDTIGGDSERDSAMLFARLIRDNSQGVSGYVQEALKNLEDSHPSYVEQEFLGAWNEPVLFTDFMNQAHSFGLQYLSESRVVMMSTDDLSKDVQDLLHRFEGDRIRKEQILDIVRNRTFRETLLCHSSIVLQEGLHTSAFCSLSFLSKYVASSVEAAEGMVSFQDRFTCRTIELPRGDFTKVIEVMERYGARGGRYAELEALIVEALSCSAREALGVLVTLWRSGFIDATTESLSPTEMTGEYRNYTDMQIAEGDKVTSPLHESYELSELERIVLKSLLASDVSDGDSLTTCTKRPMDEVESALQNLRIMGFL